MPCRTHYSQHLRQFLLHPGQRAVHIQDAGNESFDLHLVKWSEHRLVVTGGGDRGNQLLG